jgi:glycosyltransferase involved in cell wall biosynthesis
MARLSATIMTHNSMATLPACLASLEFCDEIVVVDDRSSDGTVEFLHQVAAADALPALSGKLRFFRRELDTFSAQRRALQEVADGDWLLVVDADETVSPKLAREMLELLANCPRANAFVVPMKNMLPAHWPRQIHFTSHQRRLLRSSAVRWIPTESVHATANFAGRPGKLHHPIIHHSFDSLEHLWRKQLAYGRNGARVRYGQGRRASLPGLALRSTVAFLKYYFAKGLFRFGIGGLIAAGALACESFIKYSALWTLDGRPPGPVRDRMALESIEPKL